MQITRSPDELLRRRETAKALTEAGFPTAKSTLATLATKGGGPPYQLFGRRPLYRWGNALEWAAKKLSKPVKNSSEARALGALKIVKRKTEERGMKQKTARMSERVEF